MYKTLINEATAYSCRTTHTGQLSVQGNTHDSFSPHTDPLPLLKTAKVFLLNVDELIAHLPRQNDSAEPAPYFLIN